jgi:hypothetical protein
MRWWCCCCHIIARQCSPRLAWENIWHSTQEWDIPKTKKSNQECPMLAIFMGLLAPSPSPISRSLVLIDKPNFSRETRMACVHAIQNAPAACRVSHQIYRDWDCLLMQRRPSTQRIMESSRLSKWQSDCISATESLRHDLAWYQSPKNPLS